MTDRMLRALFCSTALALCWSAPNAAHAQTAPREGAGALPPVTIDAPRARRVAQPVIRRPASVSRGASARRAPAQAQRVAPVGYVTPSTATLGAPPVPYAGGQVATGGQLGFLGNRGVMNSPFSQTSYTAELIANQQAQTIREVVENNPSVRVVTTPGGGQDGYFIRGFYSDTGDLSLNGLYGIAPNYKTGANFVERVEVLLGPSALLSGIPPAGSIGGSINLVTKKAPDFDITQVTPTYASRSQFGTLVDIARRYGEQKEFGIRFNGAYRNGGTSFDRQNEEFGNAVLGVDYRTERVRVSADVGYQSFDIKPLVRFVSFAPTVVPIPRAPQAGSNFFQDFVRWAPQDTFATVRSEVDVTDWATLYGAIGANRSEIAYGSAAPTILNAAGDYRTLPFKGNGTTETITGEVGARLKFDTGFVNHAVSVNYSAVDRTTDSNFRAGPGFIFSNIYNPTQTPEPAYTRPALVNSVRIGLQSVGFADTMSMFGDRVQFTAGVRRQEVRQETLDFAFGNNVAPTTTNAWSPAFGLVVKPLANLSLYANYIEGLQPGATVGIGNDNAGTVFAPYRSRQAETGFKVDFGTVTTTFAVFQITQPSLITVFTPGVGANQQRQELAGEQRNRGAEFNVFGEVTPGLRLLGGVALIDGRLTKTASGLNNNNTAPGVPNVQVNLGAEYDAWFAPGLTFTGRVIYTSEQFVNAANTQVLPDWVRFDLGARYTFLSPWNGKPIVVRANVLNVANASYWSSAYNSVVTVGTPRTYLVSATFNF